MKKRKKYVNGGNVAVDGLSTGLSAGLATGNPFIAGGAALLGAGNSFIQQKKLQKQQEEAEKLRINSERNFAKEQSKSVLSTFPTQGVSGVQLFKDGGKIDNLVDPSNVDQLDKDLFLFKGPKHNEGGIPLNNNAEVEGDEVLEGNEGRIYSDTLKPNKEVLDEIKSMTGISVKGTYADIVKTLGKKTSDLPDTRFSKNTERLMRDKTSKALDFLFNIQEQSKTPKFKKGGKMYRNGGSFPLLQGFGLNDLNTNVTSPNSFPQQIEKQQLSNVSFGREQTPFQQGVETVRNFLSNRDNRSTIGQGLNALNFLQNRRDINNLNTNISPVFSSAPRFTFRDPSIGQRANANQQAAQAINQINLNSSQDNSGAIAQVTAAKIAANNNAISQSAQQENQALSRFRGIESRNNIVNANVANQTNRLNNTLGNQRQSLLTQNRNALTRGFLGNLAQQDKIDSQRDVASLIALEQADRGTVDRFITDNPEIAKRLGLI